MKVIFKTVLKTFYHAFIFLLSDSVALLFFPDPAC